MEEKQREGKTAALVTYIIALLALAAGLVLPITNLTFTGGGFHFKEAPVMQLGGALASFGLPLKSQLSILYAFPVQKFDLGGALLFYYALTSAVALVLLIPAIVAKPETSRKVISVGELLPLTALLPLAALDVLKAYGIWNINLLGAFGVTLLMLVIQRIAYGKGSGVIKFILFILSAVAALFAALDLLSAVPALFSPFGKIASALNGKKPFEANLGLYTVFGIPVTGRSLIVTALFNLFELFRASEPSITVANWFAFLTVCLVLFNLFLDMLGLGKKTNSLMIVSNVIRYSVEFAFIVALAITVLFMPSSYGIMLYLLAIIALIQLLIQIIRAVVFRKAHRVAAAETVEAEEPAEENVYAPAAIPEETAAASNEAYETRNVYYNVNTIYNGPTDDFIKKLSTDEKVEFARLFLEKRTGASHGIPDYVVGGDNSRFFSMLFIYFARIRDIVSDGLMNKFYEEAKLM